MFEICLDIQGAVEEQREYFNSIKNRLKYPFIYINFVRSLKYIDSAFVVSDELKENCLKKIPNRRKKLKFYKVRCGCNSTLSYSEIKKEVKLLGIS